MGLLDKAKSLLGMHEEKVEGTLDKGADVVDDKTGGKYADQIDTGVDAGKDFVGEDEDEGDAAPPTTP